MKRVIAPPAPNHINDDNAIDPSLLKRMLEETMGHEPDRKMWCQLQQAVRALTGEPVRACLRRVARQSPGGYGYVLKALQNEAEEVAFLSRPPDPESAREPRRAQTARQSTARQTLAQQTAETPEPATEIPAQPPPTPKPLKPAREFHCARCRDSGFVWTGEPKPVISHRQILDHINSGQTQFCDCTQGLVWRGLLQLPSPDEMPKERINGSAAVATAQPLVALSSDGIPARAPRRTS